MSDEAQGHRRDRFWWRNAALGLLIAAGLVFALGERLKWPQFWLLFVGVFWEQVRDLVRSLGEWVELRYKDLVVTRRARNAVEIVEGSLMERERLSGEEASRGLDEEVSVGR